jgi:hypothetical protein
MGPRAPEAAEAEATTSLPGSAPSGSVHGSRVGFRRDVHWRSWDVITDDWARLLEGDGAHVVLWRAGVRTGHEGKKTADQLDEFLRSVDMAVVGLAN